MQYVKFDGDIWLAPFTVTNSTNRVDLVYNAAPTNIQFLTNKTYYHGSSTTFTIPSSTAESFEANLRSLLQAALTFDVTVTTQEDELGYERLGIHVDAPLEWTLKGSTSTLDLSLLGFENVDYVSKNGWIYAPFSMKNLWVSQNPFGNGALIKSPYQAADVRYSSEKIWESFAAKWGEVKVRQFQYDYLPAARLFEGRSRDANRATLAKCVLNDPNCTFKEIWSHLIKGYQAFPVIVIHDYQYETELNFFTNSWEQVDLYETWNNYNERIGDQGVAGDFWTMSISVVVRAGNYKF